MSALAAKAGFTIYPFMHGFNRYTGSGFAWVILIVWWFSPFAAYLDHGDWTNPAKLAATCLSFANNPEITDIALKAIAWMIMCWAMMMPVASLPSTVSAYGIYFLVWLAFGLLVHTVSVILADVMITIPFYFVNGWIAGVVLLLCSGLWMAATPVFHRKADQNAWQLGINCICACGPTMTLMFAFFPGNPLWMAVLAAIMYVGREGFGRELAAGAQIVTALYLALHLSTFSS